MNCFECGATEDIEHHHVVPKSRGGTKTVPLCYLCHQKAHGKTGKGLNHRKLTKEGIARAKAKGVKFGNPKWKESLGVAQKKSQEANRKRGDKTYRRVAPMLVEASESGITSVRGMLDFLNNHGCLSPRGKLWQSGSIHRLIKRAKKEKLIP